MKVEKYKYINQCLLCKNGKFIDKGPSKCPILSSKFHLLQCSKCRFVFVNPLPDEDAISQIYSMEYRLGYQSLLGKVLEIFNKLTFLGDAKFISGNVNCGRVIDIGYGSGEMLSALGPEWDKYGYDAYSKKEDRVFLEKKLGIKTLTTTKKLPSSFFDLVVLRNVIEHTVKFRSLFTEAHRLLRRGGFLFIRTPNINSLDFKLFGTNWYMTYMGGHIVFFNRDNIKTLAWESGFKPIIVRPTRSSPVLSFSRSLQLKYSISNKFLLLVSIPTSFLYSLFSVFFNNGGDILAILKKK